LRPARINANTPWFNLSAADSAPFIRLIEFGFDKNRLSGISPTYQPWIPFVGLPVIVGDLGLMEHHLERILDAVKGLPVAIFK
jgi:hypothetical protein